MVVSLRRYHWCNSLILTPLFIIPQVAPSAQHSSRPIRIFWKQDGHKPCRFRSRLKHWQWCMNTNDNYATTAVISNNLLGDTPISSIIFLGRNTPKKCSMIFYGCISQYKILHWEGEGVGLKLYHWHGFNMQIPGKGFHLLDWRRQKPWWRYGETHCWRLFWTLKAFHSSSHHFVANFWWPKRGNICSNKWLGFTVSKLSLEMFVQYWEQCIANRGRSDG